MNIVTLITTEEPGKRICYSPRYIRRQLVDYKLIEGVHYTRPFGGKKILFVWERIQDELNLGLSPIPMAAGGICHG